MKKVITTTLAALLLLAPVLGVVAEDVPGFVADVSPLLARYGLSAEQVAAFGDGAGRLDWTGTEEIDPLVFAYVFEFGLRQGGGPVDEPLVFAHTLAHQIARMSQLGLDSRQIALACAEATREMVRLMQQDRVRQQTQTGSQDDGDNASQEMVRVRLANEAEAQMIRLATRIRNSTPSGETNRIGGEEPGVPPERPVGPGAPGGPNQ